MADLFEIAGRIHSTSQEEVVTVADEILDSTKNKKQSDINAETDATLAEHTSTIQGLNSQNYMTYAIASGETPSDVLPATGSVDTIYRVGNWDGTQFDETCYSEYSWDGSSYVHISTKTQIGEVLDISAYHATGGTLAKYADLSAALGTNGANIPQNLRTGGMSVKFVQSSDNKYVQYRCKSQNFSINSDDWINVEEEVSQLGQELSIEIAKLNSAPNIKQVDIEGTSAQNTGMALLSGKKYLIQCSCPGADNATLNNSGLYYNYGSGYIKAFDADKSMFNNGFVCVLIPSNDTNLYVRTQTIDDVVDITLWNITNIEEKASKQESIIAAIASEAYSYSNLTYNDSGMPISGNIVWPDGRTGGISFYYDNSGVLFRIQYTIAETGEKYRQDFSYEDDGSFAANTIYKVNN